MHVTPALEGSLNFPVYSTFLALLLPGNNRHPSNSGYLRKSPQLPDAFRQQPFAMFIQVVPRTLDELLVGIYLAPT